MSNKKIASYIFKSYSSAVFIVFVGGVFFAGFQFYSNIVSPIQERQNRLEQKDQIIPNEFIDQADKTEKNSFDSFSSDLSVGIARTYLTYVRNREYTSAYNYVAPKLKRTVTIKNFEDEITQKHAGKVVRYRLDSVQITSATTRKLSLTAFTLNQSNQSDNYVFEITLEKGTNAQMPWTVTGFTNSPG